MNQIGCEPISQGLFLSLFSYLERLRGMAGERKDLLLKLAWKLYDLNRKRSISINHSIMEILVASYLIEGGYDVVDVEAPIEGLVADVVAEKEGRRIIVEIETGFTPADHSSDPIDYLKARIASKIARYSPRGEMFALAFPAYYIPPIPPPLLTHPSRRKIDELVRLKELVNMYYKNPPIDIKDLIAARLDELYVLHIDRGAVLKLYPEDLLSLYLSRNGEINLYRCLFDEHL